MPFFVVVDFRTEGLGVPEPASLVSLSGASCPERWAARCDAPEGLVTEGIVDR